MQEIWKNIEDFNYQVSNLGRIKSLRSNKILQNVLGTDEYFKVCLHKDKKQYNKLIHRLVAETFIPNPENKPQVNHKNGNKLDNNINNLEWCTISENTQHSFDNGLQPKLYGLDNKITKYKIEVYSFYTGVYVTTLIGKQALKDFGLDQSSVWQCLNGKIKKHKGFTFKKIML